MSAISVIRSPLRFEGAARRAIHELKYHNLRAIAPTLAAYLVRTLRDTGYKPDLIVPVPLHPARARRRGYNQSLLLAREVGRATCTPVSSDALARVREGTSQVHTTSVEARRQNVSGAFACNDASVSGRRILVVDDVCTTGATLESCAATLRSAGAIDVQGLTVAREV
jgi:competence protein ComFC